MKSSPVSVRVTELGHDMRVDVRYANGTKDGFQVEVGVSRCEYNVSSSCDEACKIFRKYEIVDYKKLENGTLSLAKRAA
jgi:hypothetical protein